MQFSIRDYAEFRATVERLCAHLCSQNIPEEKVFDSKLVLHELLGNVLQHSGGGAVLYVEMEEESIAFRIQADRSFIPPPCVDCPNEYAERGRGLYLVDSVCVERLVTPEGDIVVKLKR